MIFRPTRRRTVAGAGLLELAEAPWCGKGNTRNDRDHGAQAEQIAWLRSRRVRKSATHLPYLPLRAVQIVSRRGGVPTDQRALAARRLYRPMARIGHEAKTDDAHPRRRVP